MSGFMQLNQVRHGGRIAGPYAGVMPVEVPTSGDSGPGYLAEAAARPQYAGKRISGFITSIPAGLTLTWDRTSAFDASGADGHYAVGFELRADETLEGTETFYIDIGDVHAPGGARNVTPSTSGGGVSVAGPANAPGGSATIGSSASGGAVTAGVQAPGGTATVTGVASGGAVKVVLPGIQPNPHHAGLRRNRHTGETP